MRSVTADACLRRNPCCAPFESFSDLLLRCMEEEEILCREWLLVDGGGVVETTKEDGDEADIIGEVCSCCICCHSAGIRISCCDELLWNIELC